MVSGVAVQSHHFQNAASIFSRVRVCRWSWIVVLRLFNPRSSSILMVTTALDCRRPSLGTGSNRRTLCQVGGRRPMVFLYQWAHTFRNTNLLQGSRAGRHILYAQRWNSRRSTKHPRSAANSEPNIATVRWVNRKHIFMNFAPSHTG